MNDEKTNPLRENADKQLLATLLAKNATREKHLALYDAKVTMQEAIAYAVLTRAAVVETALVANTLSNGQVHVDTLLHETAENMVHFDKFETKPISIQQEEQFKRQYQLDRYEESIALRELAVNKVHQILNQNASANRGHQGPATAATPKE
jgi:hypothetical protein